MHSSDDRRGDEITALICLDDHGRELERWTYARLEARVHAAAARLSTIAEPGDRALISASTESALLIAVLACLRAGVAAVPVNLFGSDPALAERTDASLLIAPSQPDPSAPVIRALASRCDGLEVVSLDDAAPSPASLDPAIDPDGLAILFDDEGGIVCTSVGLSHDQLDRQLASFAAVAPLSAGEVFVSWLPYGRTIGRTLGLLATLHAFNQGATVVTLPTAAVLRDPQLWLQTMTRHRAAISAAPGFALERSARLGHLPRDVGLYALHTLLSAPEALTSLAWARHRRSFCARLSSVGLRPEAVRPIYVPSICATLACAPQRGQARILRVDREALGAGVLREGAGEAVELASLGRPLPGIEVELVDPHTRLACAPGRVGEIELRGPSLGITRERLRTGELGALVDGELVLCGQLPGRRADPSLAELAVG